MSAVDDKFADLIGRYAATSPSAELAFLATQPSEKQAVVRERLGVIDEYLSTVEPSVADVDAAASRLGVSRRQFYRLVAKVRSDGPVRGLLPGFQRVSRSSAAKDGLAEPIDALLVSELRNDPDIKIARLASLVTTRADELGVEPPSDWKLRHRVHALRASGIVGTKADFGSSMVVDQIALELPVVWKSGKPWYCVATLIVDRRTRMIAGAATTVTDGIVFGLEQALSDVGRRMTGFREQRFPVAANLKELTWVVPPGLENVAGAAQSEAHSDRRQVSLEVIDNPSRRQGDRILRLLGDKLGPFNFRTRTEPGIRSELPESEGVSLDHAWTVVQHAVDAWNSKLIARLAEVNDDDMAKRAKRLSRIEAQLQTVFQPVISRLEDGYKETDFFPL